MSKFPYGIVEILAVLSESPKGWRKEFNLITWNGRAPVYDLLHWAPNHVKMGKGTTLTKAEMLALKKAL